MHRLVAKDVAVDAKVGVAVRASISAALAYALDLGRFRGWRLSRRALLRGFGERHLAGEARRGPRGFRPGDFDEVAEG